MNRATTLLFASILALASMALPWQIDVERSVPGHAANMPMQHVGVMAGEANDGAEPAPHDHGAECFWCVAMVGTLAAASPVVRTDAADTVDRVVEERTAAADVATKDAAPRAPPASPFVLA